ncbi:hypothetical protein RZE82_08005 [Mollicutes bacterium LVI A0039]|nr:hypothetical protein RZE82_08005 [Mollicutes bacterium LVI A0039]
MGRVKNRKRSTNYIGATYLIFTVILSTLLLYNLSDFGHNFIDYQVAEVNNLKLRISEILHAGEFNSEDLTLLNNSYNFEVIIQKNDEVVYTSNSLYDISVANDVYNNNYIYKETYIDNDYVIWLVVTSVDFVNFVNNYLFMIIIGLAILFLMTTIYVTVIYRRIAIPLLNVMELIRNLRTKDNPEIDMDTQLDLVSNELLTLYNSISLRAYILDQQQSEYQRISEIRKSTIDEQNAYLRTMIHDIKTPLSAIGFSRMILDNEQHLSPEGIKALNYIKSQTENALELIVESLETIADDSLTSFDAIDEIDVKKLLTEYFEKNNLQLSLNNLEISIFDDELYIYTNRIKFLQILSNILSNMMQYANDDSTLNISREATKIVFKNEIGSLNSKYSTGVGQLCIVDYSKDLGIETDTKIENGYYIVTLDLKELYV